MIARTLSAVLICLALAPSLAAEVVEAEGDGYKARAHFTSAVRNDGAVDKLERASFELENLVLFIEWSNLESRTYHKAMKAFDPYGALVNEWFYDFTPEYGVWNTWDSFELGECITLPGTWRFEIYLDGEIVLKTKIPVDPKSDT